MTMSYTFNRDGTYEHTGYVEPGPLVRVQSIIKESGTISLQKDRLILKIRTGTFEQYDGQHQLVNRKERDDLREEEHRWRLETGRGGRTLWLDDVSYSEKR